MTVFLLLLGKLIPLYALIALGMWAGVSLDVRRESVARLLIYIIAPVVVFHGTVIAHLTRGLLFLPILFYTIAVLLCLLSYAVGRWVFRDSTRNLQAFAAGTGNTGYFGIPVALSLLGEAAFPIVVIANFGLILYEVTFGLFMIARGHLSIRDSIRKILGIPTLYAFVLGLVLNALHVQLPQAALDIAVSFRGAYTVLGMMMIGLGLAGIKRVSLDGRFLAMAFIAKFVIWPLFALGFIAADVHVFHIFAAHVYRVILLLSIVPMAANTVAYAAELKTHPEKAASAVLLTTLFALFFIPFIVSVAL